MGFFTKKENRVYSLEQALKLLKTPKYENYTTVPVENGFKIVPETKIVVHSNAIETNGFKERRGKFLSQVSEQGTYRDDSTLQNYNNYQTAVGNQKQSCRNLGR